MIRYSTALRNAIASGTSLAEALADGRLYVYSGAQPATADTDASGTLLVVFTKGGVTFVAPERASAKITLAGVSGSVDSITVGGLAQNLLSAPVTFDISASTTAAAVAANINAKRNAIGITALAVGADITLSTPIHLGAGGAGLGVSVATTTLTAQINGGSSTVFGGAGAPSAGVNASGGLNWKHPAVTGVISKESDLWSGIALATGSAGWFRYVAGGSAVNGLSTSDVRLDGNIATAGADLNVSNLNIAAGTTQVVGDLSFTVRASL
jgi:hypothetical protein